MVVDLRNELADYLQSSGNREPWAVCHSAGWHNGAYILPSGEIIGTPHTPTIFRSQSAEQAKGYGTKGTIEWLLQPESQALAKAVYAEQKEKWLARLPDDASPQVQRVAGRFAVLETALQLAKHLTLWTVHTNSEALLHCFNEWVNEFGLHSKEEKQVIEQVNGWLLANAEGRFIRFPIDEKQRQTIHNIAGYRMTLTDSNDREHFYLYPIAFEEAMQGHPKKQTCQILADKGMLKRGNEQGYEFMMKLPHKVDPKRSRCYLLYPISEPDTEQEQPSLT